MARWIKFLGTAGARFVMIRQIRSSAGVWYHLDGLNILLDPGPGTLVRCATSRPRLDPGQLDALILSHKHIDHSSDINVMIEAMTDGGFKKRGVVLAPLEALEEDPVILQYVREYPGSIFILEAEQTYRLSEQLSIQTSPRHKHPVETYGLKFRLPDLCIGHLIDTIYFDGLIDVYCEVDVLVIHLVRYKGETDQERGIMHLNLADAEKILQEIRPKMTVLTHFGMTMIKQKPWEIASALSERLNLTIQAASDGMTLDLEKL